MNTIKSLINITTATVALLAMPTSLQARHLTPEQALRNAVVTNPRIASNTHTPSSGANECELAYTVETNDIPTVYVFNRDAGGYYVVAADDVATNGLLGYTDTGDFDPQTAPANILGILDDYGRQITFASENDDAWRVESDEIGADRPEIIPLITTQWGQGGRYALCTPKIDGRHCPTGCVATAIGQIMNFYRWANPHGTISYKASTLGVTFNYDFNDLTIDFDAFNLGAEPVATDETQDAISQFLYACGMAVKMNYGKSASNSGLQAAAAGLLNYFGYDKAMRYLYRNFYDDAEWEDLVYTELAAGRPVFYSGISSKEGGHAFICDGYDGQGYYHMNWGWDGALNGYFLLSALDPRCNSQGFDNQQGIIVGIQPETPNSLPGVTLTLSGDMTVDPNEITRDQEVNLGCSAGIFNQSLLQITVFLGARLEAADGEVIYVATPTDKILNPQGAIKSYSIHADQFPLEGTYRMTLAARLENSGWFDMLVKTDAKVRAYIVTCSPDYILFETEEEFAAKNQIVNIDDIDPRSSIDDVDSDIAILSEEFFTTTGCKVGQFAPGQIPQLASGIYIVRRHMADGTIRVVKTFK